MRNVLVLVLLAVSVRGEILLCNAKEAVLKSISTTLFLILGGN
jgi:hypothetical protein